MQIENFHNKVIMITGAASGFGKLLAEQLAGLGARLILGDRNETGLAEVAALLRKSGAEVVAMRCDVSHEADVKALVDAGVKNFGRLDIGVNNAGLSSPMKSLLDTEESDLDINFAVNAKGVFFGMKYQIKQMLTQGGGTVLNVSSMAGLGGAPKLAAYCASKHAVVGLTKTAAIEFGRKNIRVNAICPFYSLTPMVTDSLAGDLESQQLLATGSPMKRLGQPQEIVSVMLMLCAPENSYMTGQAIAVDGGVSAS
ncbi:SDR family NAD(P)-dependent oxidoreductase [Glaciimonas soli]|uniref:Glucose 1-dehydrogenase n=1 Tax=Glaciimonas soli TaxID=2590999 RepID=A0A843YIP9_9BURK|nr:glucose 1-dehydrogenase [Glaciimonas soli]MQQ99234.1 glucose 1-dehydrogenase [Glaciimonas soli]